MRQRRRSRWAPLGCAALLFMGCADPEAAPVEVEESVARRREPTAVDTPAAPRDVAEAEDPGAYEESETVVEIVGLHWRQIPDAREDVEVAGQELDLVLENFTSDLLEATLELTVRADGVETVTPLGTVWVDPEGSVARHVQLDASHGVDLESAEFPVQAIVQATLRDVDGELRGSKSTGDLYALRGSDGSPVLATAEALRLNHGAGAPSEAPQAPDALRGGADEADVLPIVDVASYGRGRMATPRDLRGDPADTLGPQALEPPGGV